MQRRVIPIQLLLLVGLLLAVPRTGLAAPGQCDGTPDGETYTCATSPTTPDANVEADKGSDSVTIASGVVVNDVRGDGVPGGLDTALGYAIGNGGDDVIVLNGIVSGQFNISGDYVIGNGGNDNITVNGPVDDVFGDNAAGSGGSDTITLTALANVFTVSGDYTTGGGANDTITNNGLVRGGIAGDTIFGTGAAGSDTITNTLTGVAAIIVGDGITGTGAAGGDNIVNAGTVVTDIYGDYVVLPGSSVPSGLGAGDTITNRGLVGGAIYAEGGDDTVNLQNGTNGGSDNLLFIDGGTGTDTLNFELTLTAVTNAYGTPTSGVATLNGITYQWANFESVNGIGLVQLTSPVGVINTPYGNPVYTWSAVPGATSYELYLDSAENDGVPIYSGTGLLADTLCGGGATCAIDLTTLTENARLPADGDYVVYIRATIGDLPLIAAGPFSFTLDAPQPAPPTPGVVSFTDSLRPTFNWSLTPNANFSTAFYVYVIRKDFFNAGNYTPAYAAWHTRTAVCGSVVSTVCTLQSPVNLEDNTQYWLFLLGYAPGGYSTGGMFGNGWSGVEFTVDMPAPGVPQNIIVAPNQGRPTIQWDDEPTATHFTVVLYEWLSSTFVYVQAYNRTGSPALTCTGTTCTLIDETIILGNGSYSAFVNAVGLGGASSGGDFANGYGGPVDGQNPNEPGDFVYQFAAPEIVIDLSGSYVGGNFTTTFTAVTGASWYQVWVGTENAASTAHIQWYSSNALGCPNLGICTVAIPLTLPAGTHYTSVLSAGPGGFSSGGTGGYAVSSPVVVP